MASSKKSKSNELDKTLAKDSKRLHDWVNSTNVSHTTSVYLFDVRDEITEPGYEFTGHWDDVNDAEDPKPITVAQVGPFKFRQEREIEVIGYDRDSFSEDHDLLVVSIRKFYHYIDEGADLDQKISVLNTPLQLLYHHVKKYRVVKRPLYDLLDEKVNKPILNKLPLFVTRTVRDVLFGYSDETVQQIPTISEIFESYGLELNVNEYIRDGKFSLINSRNGASTGPMTLKTGTITDDWKIKTKVDLSLVGQLYEIGANQELIEVQEPTNPAWQQMPCKKIQGTLPGVYPPNPSATIKIYETEMERTIELNEVPSEKQIGEQKVRKFVWSQKNFKRWKENPKETRSCLSSMTMWHRNLCETMSGFQRKTGRRGNTPTVYSLPHFLHATELVLGVQPEPSLHESFIELEDDSGALVRERTSLQVNIDTSGCNLPLDIWPNMELFFPIYWFEEESISENEN